MFTTHITEAQIARSFADCSPSTEVTIAIEKAEDLHRRGAGEMTVVRTKGGKVEVFSEFAMTVRAKDVEEAIYSAPHGFHMPLSA